MQPGQDSPHNDQALVHREPVHPLPEPGKQPGKQNSAAAIATYKNQNQPEASTPEVEATTSGPKIRRDGCVPAWCWPELPVW
jgi:hypothetical protein